MDHKKGPKNKDEAKQFIANLILEALLTENIPYVWYHQEDWKDQTQQRFDIVRKDCVKRIKKWGKIKN